MSRQDGRPVTDTLTPPRPQCLRKSPQIESHWRQTQDLCAPSPSSLAVHVRDHNPADGHGERHIGTSQEPFVSGGEEAGDNGGQSP
jgi:hypothetical protein